MNGSFNTIDKVYEGNVIFYYVVNIIRVQCQETLIFEIHNNNIIDEWRFLFNTI